MENDYRNYFLESNRSSLEHLYCVRKNTFLIKTLKHVNILPYFGTAYMMYGKARYYLLKRIFYNFKKNYFHEKIKNNLICFHFIFYRQFKTPRYLSGMKE